ncbi:MAG: hemerythrin domain-containing protein [Planctomycetota bacterium]
MNDPQTDPIDQLMDEHRVIESVVGAIRKAAQSDVDLDFYADLVDFIANFADGLHHGKEEDRLFPLLEERGLPREGGPIGVMLQEHRLGREHVARMREGLEAADRDALRRESRAYAALLEGHIMKEDSILYPMGRNVFRPGDVERLQAAFADVDPTGEEGRRYRDLARSLVERAQPD